MLPSQNLEMLEWDGAALEEVEAVQMAMLG